jgi:hypothetical protein
MPPLIETNKLKFPKFFEILKTGTTEDYYFVEGKIDIIKVTLLFYQTEYQRYSGMNGTTYDLRITYEDTKTNIVTGDRVYSSSIKGINSGLARTLDNHRSIDNGFLTIRDLMNKVNTGEFASGLSGTLAKYELKSCVISYAVLADFCVAVLKFTKTYVAVYILGKDAGCRIYTVDLKQAIDKINEINTSKPEVLEMTKEQRQEVMAKLI